MCLIALPRIFEKKNFLLIHDISLAKSSIFVLAFTVPANSHHFDCHARIFTSDVVSRATVSENNHVVDGGVILIFCSLCGDSQIAWTLLIVT